MAQLANGVSKYAEDMSYRSGESCPEYFNRSEALMNKLLKESDDIPEGQVVGAILSWGVADGKAFYQVVSEKPLRLQHIPFGDAYEVSPILIRGLRIGDVRDMVKMNRRRAALWNKK